MDSGIHVRRLAYLYSKSRTDSNGRGYGKRTNRVHGIPQYISVCWAEECLRYHGGKTGWESTGVLFGGSFNIRKYIKL